DRSGDPFAEFERVVAMRRDQTDEFYAAIIPTQLSADGRNVMRQALAGLLWSKQFYHYDIGRWLDGDPGDPPPAVRRAGRNRDWRHLYNEDVISYAVFCLKKKTSGTPLRTKYTPSDMCIL